MAMPSEYSNYVTFTEGSATWFERLRLYLVDVSDAITQQMSADGFAEDGRNWLDLRAQLQGELRDAVKTYGDPTAKLKNGGVSVARFEHSRRPNG